MITMTFKMDEVLQAAYKSRCKRLNHTMQRDMTILVRNAMKGDVDAGVLTLPKLDPPKPRKDRPLLDEPTDPGRLHFWIRRTVPDRLILSFNTILRCGDIAGLLVENGGELA